MGKTKNPPQIIPVNLYPDTCNICGGEVVYISNALIYGREYGSGKMYYCVQCGAFVGTHVPRPTEALGILANGPMRQMKQKCHALFDPLWNSEATPDNKHQARRRCYRKLAKKMGLDISSCHFGYFDMPLLLKAHEILENGLFQESAHVTEKV